jgi:hypothetical protein
MTDQHPHCLYCERESDEVPLIALIFRGLEMWICPQHLPILIHKPAQLAELLPGAERLSPVEPEHHHQ